MGVFPAGIKKDYNLILALQKGALAFVKDAGLSNDLLGLAEMEDVTFSIGFSLAAILLLNALNALEAYITKITAFNHLSSLAREKVIFFIPNCLSMILLHQVGGLDS